MRKMINKFLKKWVKMMEEMATTERTMRVIMKATTIGEMRSKEATTKTFGMGTTTCTTTQHG